MLRSCKLTLQPDATGSWSCLDGCTRSSASDTHILFFSEVQVSGFSISQLILAVSQRKPLELCLNIRNHNILNAQVFNQKVLILSYTSQTPFLTIYDFNTNEYKYSGTTHTHMFTKESYDCCLKAPGSLVLLNNYIIFNFSRNSPLFACELNKISDIDSYLQLNCSGICAPIINKHQLWVFDKSLFYVYSINNLLRAISKHDIGTYKVHNSTLRELILPPIVIEKFVIVPVTNCSNHCDKLIISFINAQCFELDMEKKQLTMLTPLVTDERQSPNLYTSTTQFLFYFRETVCNKFIMHSLRFTVANDISNILSMPVGYQLYIFEDKQRNHMNKSTVRSFKDLLKEAIMDHRFQEAIDACRPDADISMTATQKAYFMRNIIRRVAKECVCNQGASILNEAEMEQSLRNFLHRYAEHKLRKPRHTEQSRRFKNIHIGSSDAKENIPEPAITHIVTRTYTSEELTLARHVYKQSLFCEKNNIYYINFTQNMSPCTHLLTPEPAIWSRTVSSCNMFTHAGISVFVVLCQYNLYVYFL